MDLTGAQGAVDKLTKETVPQIGKVLDDFVSSLHSVLDRLDGATLTLNLKLGGRSK